MSLCTQSEKEIYVFTEYIESTVHSGELDELLEFNFFR